MGKFDALLEDADDIFGGTPESKYWDIFNQISKDLAHDAFDSIIERIAAMECLLMETIPEEEINARVKQYIFSHPGALDEHKKSLYMELAGELIYRVSD